ncbi:transforming growth factor beta-1-induced transcript 1 protein [Gastrophryne carolinensis]
MEDLDALLADLQVTSPTRCPVLLTDSLERGAEPCERPPPPPYGHKATHCDSIPEISVVDKTPLYSTVKKNGMPPVSAAVGGGLCELDRLLNELNSTQYNITDKIMSQFPLSSGTLAEKPEERRVLSASSATQELERLMASLSDFHKQSTVSIVFIGFICHVTMTSQLHHSFTACTASLGQQEASAPGPGILSPTDTTPPVASSGSVEVTEDHPAGVPGSEKDGGGEPRGDLDSMMVKLQSGLKEQGIETQSKGLCHSCQRPIAGQVVTALGRVWHPEHFVCTHCKSLIGSTNFFEKDGRPYCEKDYFELHAPRCAMCDVPILQNLVTALGRTWHPEHFCCIACRKPIGEEGFHEKEGAPYCSDDYFRLFGAVCAGCSEAVKESYISALHRLWHPQCFVCHVCHSPFINGSFFENDGVPLCETHYHSSRGSLCAGCDQPITGRCVTAMGRKFHPQHLTCTFCLRQLSKGTFREQEGKPYCQACFTRLYG